MLQGRVSMSASFSPGGRKLDYVKLVQKGSYNTQHNWANLLQITVIHPCILGK